MKDSNETKRIALFLIGCMGARSLLVYLAYQKSTRLYASLFTSLVAIGFMYIYLTGSRKTGPEVFGDRIWWNDPPIKWYGSVTYTLSNTSLTLRILPINRIYPFSKG
jgi:hypothetical protein